MRKALSALALTAVFVTMSATARVAHADWGHDGKHHRKHDGDGVQLGARLSTSSRGWMTAD